MTSLVDAKSTFQQSRKIIKCVVWDLDDTLWRGVLLEDSEVVLRECARETITTLDDRGILQSIASRNDYDKAMAKLQHLQLSEYFIHPQINWNSKAVSVQTIADSINIGLDSIAFIDDQPFEREEVSHSLSQVLCIDADELDGLLGRPEMMPQFITEDSKARRLMYISDVERKKAEEGFVGPKEEFLAQLNMVFTISSAKEEDLKRAAELTFRTNQLNTTGRTYSYDELNNLRKSSRHKLMVADLEDRYGTYGKIGLALVECRRDAWIINLLLMSCRVMSRGVGMILINHIMRIAKERGVRLLARFVANERNRMTYMTYKFSGFKEIEKTGNVALLENGLEEIQPFPEYVKVQVLE